MTEEAAGRRTFPDISSRAREHPADRTALTALRRLKGFDQILKVLSGMLRERQHRLLYLASSARVGSRQFADLDALLDDFVSVLDAPVKPELFAWSGSSPREDATERCGPMPTPPTSSRAARWLPSHCPTVQPP